MAQENMKRLIIALCALGLAFSTVSWSQDHDAEISERDYVLGNTLFTLLHEVGHGLVDVWQLPLLGRQEDAVDAFSVTFVAEVIQDDKALSDEQLAQLDRYYWVAADTWLAYSEIADTSDMALYAAEHSLDYQRFFSHVCLVIGSDPDFYSDWIEEFKIEEADLDPEACEEQFALKSDDWAYLLEQERDQDWKDTGTKGIQIVIEEPVKKTNARFRKMAESWDWLRYFERRMETKLKLPQPIVVYFASCDGDANAYYDLEEQAVTMCYELMAEYAQFYNGE